MSSDVLSHNWAFLFFDFAEGPGGGDVPLLLQKVTIMSPVDVSSHGSGGNGTEEQSIGGWQASWGAFDNSCFSVDGVFGVI